jgi:hypothetical protein
LSIHIFTNFKKNAELRWSFFSKGLSVVSLKL